MCGPKLFSLATTFLTHSKQDEEMLGNILDCPMCRKNSLRHLFAQFIGWRSNSNDGNNNNHNQCRGRADGSQSSPNKWNE